MRDWSRNLLSLIISLLEIAAKDQTSWSQLLCRCTRYLGNLEYLIYIHVTYFVPLVVFELVHIRTR